MAWQVYIDDSGIVCVYFEGADPAKVQLQAVAKQQYEVWQAPLSLAKSRTRLSRSARLGAAVDGSVGTLGLPASKAVKL
eukprot:5513021-Amphidinium_carterae.1